MKDLDILVEMFARVGKPVMENTQPPTITYQPIVLDLNWMNNYDEATAPESRKRLMKAVSNMGVGNILQLDNFVNDMNGILTGDIDTNDHVSAIAKIDVLRTLHNLLGSEESQRGGGASGKGFLFEIFIADVFGGKVVAAGDAKGQSKNIADVEFPNANVSLKFVKQGSKVFGSYDNLLDSLRTKGEITYIVGEKNPAESEINFYQFTVNEEVITTIDSTLTKRIKNRLVKGRKIVRDPDTGEVVRNPDTDEVERSGGTFVLSKAEIMKEKGPYQFKPLGILNMKDAVKRTSQLFQALDAKFQNLFSTLQELNQAAETFKTDAQATKDKKSTSAQKGRTTRKAGAVRKASQKI